MNRKKTQLVFCYCLAVSVHDMLLSIIQPYTIRPFT
uniref:Uncharacterized protein n=1 Tax=Arundo donax TaxID=35708 RepID=A0A0A8YG38_ARUDO